jgi:2-methylcitrate dehydratase PrpD
MSGAVEVLAGVALRPVWDDASEATRELVRCSVRDWLTVAIAGAADPTVGRLRDLTAPAAAGAPMSATVIGGTRVSASGAASLNGLSGHVLDFDDTSTGPMEGHPSAVLMPPLLAAAEARDLRLRDVFAAYAAGVQVAHDLGAWVSPLHYAQGWHATATVGSVGAAAATARLLDLSPDEVRSAIAIAGTQAAGVKSAFGSLAKPLQVGRAAAVALEAAFGASVGATCPDTVLDEHPAFGRLPGGSARRGLDGSEAGPPAVEKTLIKWHAACHSTHAGVEAWSRLHVDPDSVEWVEVGVRPDLLDVCGIDQPSTPLELKFSIRGVLAMAVAGIDTADPAAYSCSTLQAVTWASAMSKVRVRAEGLSSEWQTSVTVRERAGRRHTLTVDLRQRPRLEETRERLARKFDRLVPPVLGSGPADDLWKLLSDPDELGVGELMTLVGADR